MEIIITYLSNCLSILGLILIFGLIMDLLERLTLSYGSNIFGKNIITTISSYIGTPIHELGHLFFAILFAHTINKVVLFPKKENVQKGVLGYVSHSWNKKNIYQKFGNFFIGIGPMISGPIVILLILKLLLPTLYSEMYLTISDIIINNKNVIETFSTIFLTLIKMFFSLDNLSNIKFYIFLFLSMNISAHMGLSFADVKHSVFSLISLGIIVLIIAIFVPYFNIINTFVIFLNSILCALFSIAIILSLINVIIFKLLFNLLYR